MIIMPLASSLALFGMALAPVTGHVQLLSLPLCGAETGARVVIIHSHPTAPRPTPDCDKACHAVNDRRNKQDGEDESCC